MALDPLKAMATSRAKESALESFVLISAVGLCWYGCHTLFSLPALSRPVTLLELAAMLGASAAIVGWCMGRHLYMAGKRSPKNQVLWGIVGACGFVSSLRPLVRVRFAGTCEEKYMGAVVETLNPAVDDQLIVACQINGVPDNPYLPGTLIHPVWNGEMDPYLWVFIAFMAMLGALGLRDWRMRPTQMPTRINDELRLAPATGPEGIPEGPPVSVDGKIVACSNPTLWGEVCGQIYAAEKVWESGEWCVRCQQPFRKNHRELTFSVVSLFTSDIDVLNGLERLDTVSWDRGDPMPPDARISGQERWVNIGAITVPDVITMAQLLALVHKQLPNWDNPKKEEVQDALKVAKARASRICAWVWFGRQSTRLTYARPTSNVLFGIGPNRLRDLIPQTGHELVLQLDTGLLPLEMRLAFKKTFLEEGRAPVYQNSKLDMWIPVSPPADPKKATGDGIWVDRIEGKALRAWLSTDRLRPEGLKGVSVPLAYHAYDANQPPKQATAVQPGSLDLVRMEHRGDGDQTEPDMVRRPGDSLAEWDWLEWEQIQLLRRECIVLMNTSGRE